MQNGEGSERSKRQGGPSRLAKLMVAIAVVSAVVLLVLEQKKGSLGREAERKEYLAGKKLKIEETLTGEASKCADRLSRFLSKSKQGKCVVPVARDVMVHVNGEAVASGDVEAVLDRVLCAKTAKFNNPRVLMGEMLLFQMEDGAMVQAKLRKKCVVTHVFLIRKPSGTEEGPKGSGSGWGKKKKNEEKKERVGRMNENEKLKNDDENGEGDFEDVGSDLISAHWNDDGCFEDGRNGRLVRYGGGQVGMWTDNLMSRQACKDWGASNYFKYAGVENGNECFIGTWLAYTTGTTGGCTTTCGAWWTFESCGGTWRIHLFRDVNYIHTKTGTWHHFSGIHFLSLSVSDFDYLYGVKTDGTIVSKQHYLVGGWQSIPGGLKNIAVGLSNYVLVGVNSQGTAYQRTGVSYNNRLGTGWVEIGYGFKMLAVGSRYVYGIKTNNAVQRQPYSTALSNSKWVANPGGGGLSQISAHGTYVAGVNHLGHVYSYDENTALWTKWSVPYSGLWASQSKTGKMSVVTTGHDILQYDSNNKIWTRITGGLVQFDTPSDIRRVGVNSASNGFFLVRTTA